MSASLVIQAKEAGEMRYIAKWQATNWPRRNSRIVGSSFAQRVFARGQRVWKRQPDGGAIGEGGSPVETLSAIAASGSGRGIASSSSEV